MIIIPLLLMFVVAVLFMAVFAKLMILLMVPLLFLVFMAAAAKICFSIRRQKQIDGMQSHLAYLEARAKAEKAGE